MRADYAGLAALAADLRAALGPAAAITAAYYPDGRQEALLLATKACVTSEQCSDSTEGVACRRFGQLGRWCFASHMARQLLRIRDLPRARLAPVGHIHADTRLQDACKQPGLYCRGAPGA